MSDFTGLTGRFRSVTKNNVQDSTRAKVIRKPRESYVCTPCKQAKLKCDRNQPCGSCVKRGDNVLCNYPRLSSSTRGGNTDSNRHSVAEDRLLHLESLVSQLMENQASARASRHTAPVKPVLPPPVAPFGDASGGHHEEPNSATYVGSTHWSAILEDIQELKAALAGTAPGRQGDNDNILSATCGTPSGCQELIFGFSGNYSSAQILSQYLPPRHEVDWLLAIYLQGETFIVPFIHAYHFQRQYREFWGEMTSVNPLWLSMLFSVCSIATAIKGAHGGSLSDEPMTTASSNFHTAAGQCLVLGEYYRLQPLAVEALGLYAQFKNLRSLDPSREAGAILGMVVRMAYEMGYHRDPDSFGSFTVFEGEMRRRFWSTCKQMDLMISFQLGLPSTICLENCDTKSPRNLMDSDFDEDSSALPPSRPENEMTRLLWFIVKDRQMAGFGKVYQDVLSFKEKTESEVLQLDQEIQWMYETTPEILRTRPLSESIADSPFVIMTRLYINFIYLKSLLVLHRRYMARGNLSSTRSCVNAGTRLVGQFIAMYKEMAPGGLLHAERWMLTNFTMNDFLLGVMVLCLIVHIRRQSLPKGIPTSIDAASEAKAVALLEQAVVICIEKSSQSKDAVRVSIAIRLVLDGSKSPNMADTNKAFSQHINQSNNAHISQDLDLAPSLLQSQENQYYPSGDRELSFGLLDPFNFMGNDFESMDWMTFESNILGRDGPPAYPGEFGTG
ncbi:Fungal Zn2-Cys6 binuclear cluster domain-containing protein [Cladophialophora immunda]|nr:Fungal Zn2-Cys6 binuclear cluster domain-containing protein [Cladophialophora immunda]